MQFIIWLSVLSTFKTIHGWCGDEGCIFEGQAYAPNVPVQFGCFVFQCIQTSSIPITDTWQFLYINGSCANCSVRVDPHFRTFDNHYYDFHGKCKYAISQPIGECGSEDSSNNPPYGIFGDFRLCVNGFSSPTCLDLTTYKISDDISILIQHTSYPPTLEINGSPLPVSTTPVSYYDCSYFSSVIVWQSGNCIFIVGEHYSIYACFNSILVYTVPEHIKKIAGLCGYYTGATVDDFLLRDCTYESLSNEIPFGENWKTIDQIDGECIDSDIEVIDCDELKREQAKRICESTISRAQEKCSVGYSKEEFASVMEDCIEDCCAAGLENCETLAKAGAEFLCSLTELEGFTKREEKGK